MENSFDSITFIYRHQWDDDDVFVFVLAFSQRPHANIEIFKCRLKNRNVWLNLSSWQEERGYSACQLNREHCRDGVTFSAWINRVECSFSRFTRISMELWRIFLIKRTRKNYFRCFSCIFTHRHSYWPLQENLLCFQMLQNGKLRSKLSFRPLLYGVLPY